MNRQNIGVKLVLSSVMLSLFALVTAIIVVCIKPSVMEVQHGRDARDNVCLLFKDINSVVYLPTEDSASYAHFTNADYISNNLFGVNTVYGITDFPASVELWHTERQIPSFLTTRYPIEEESKEHLCYRLSVSKHKNSLVIIFKDGEEIIVNIGELPASKVFEELVLVRGEIPLEYYFEHRLGEKPDLSNEEISGIRRAIKRYANIHKACNHPVCEQFERDALERVQARGL